MSANSNLSKKISSTTKNTTKLHNNSSNENKCKLLRGKEDSRLKVIVTKHLCIPCPRLYTDIFNKVVIICKDPSHKEYSSDTKIRDNSIQFISKKIENDIT